MTFSTENAYLRFLRSPRGFDSFLFFTSIFNSKRYLWFLGPLWGISGICYFYAAFTSYIRLPARFWLAAFAPFWDINYSNREIYRSGSGAWNGYAVLGQSRRARHISRMVAPAGAFQSGKVAQSGLPVVFLSTRFLCSPPDTGKGLGIEPEDFLR